MNDELIQVAKKAANSWRYTDEYHQAAFLIDMLVQQCESLHEQYKKAKETIEFIMGSQKYCMMCGNNACKNSTTGEVGCDPAWDEKAPWDTK